MDKKQLLRDGMTQSDKNENLALVSREWLVAVDSLLSCLLYRHKSAMVRIGEIDEVRKLANQARALYKKNEKMGIMS